MGTNANDLQPNRERLDAERNNVNMYDEVVTGPAEVAFSELQAATPADVRGPIDLRCERYREYANADGSVYRISDPLALYYREGGSTHRVVDKQGVVHCVDYPAGLNGSIVALRWVNRDKRVPVNF